MAVCYIVGAGEVKERICPGPDDFVIAADGGLEALERLWIRPHLILGDFDSLGRIPQGENVRRLPVEKDETDMAAAVREGYVRGYRSFRLYGGCGGREDHTLANIAVLYRIAREGGRGYLTGNGFVRTVIVNEALHIPPRKAGTVSVFSMTEESRGVGIRGLKYELRDATLTADTPLGVSNSFTGDAAEISVREGALLIMWESEGAEGRLP